MSRELVDVYVLLSSIDLKSFVTCSQSNVMLDTLVTLIAGY